MTDMTSNRRALAGAAAAFCLLQIGICLAGDLTIGDGVVVKFGSDAQLVVRDKITVGKGVAFTSQKDDTLGGKTNPAAKTAAPGDWRGVRVEKSSAPYGSQWGDGTIIRFGGGSGAAGLTLRGVSPSFNYLQTTDSTVGLRLQAAASPRLSGASILRNGVGIEANDNAAPIVAAGQFVGNTTRAISNNTPATPIQAIGNWWGDASGPKDSAGNPRGLGDAVSTGVDYGQFLTQLPLINPSIQLAAAASYIDRSSVDLVIGCVNATQYRIAEDGLFSDVSFQPLANSQAAVSVPLSRGDGRKQLSVEFRNAAGVTMTAALAGGVLVDTQAPQLSITSPVAGSTVSTSTVIVANASDANGIDHVDFYLDGALQGKVSTLPYKWNWNTDATADGAHTWRVVVFDGAGRMTEQSRSVTFSRYVVPPDTNGPATVNLSFGGAILADGATLAATGNVSANVSDASGVARVELLLDGTVVSAMNGAGGTYTALLNLDGVANGSHVVAIRATDSLNNVSTTSLNVTVAHAIPNAPQLASPASGTTTRYPNQTVTGKAQANRQVQLYVNGAAAGTSISTDGSGAFSGQVVLAAGANQIQAKASDAYGTSTFSNTISITLDTSVPAAPGNLLAASQAGGKIHLTWTRSTDANAVNIAVYRSKSPFAAITEASQVATVAAASAAYDDMPTQDGTYYYRLVALNNASTPSDPTNQAQAVADNKAPRASIVYAPLGKVDSATGRTGQGRVNVTLTVTEALQAAPYLAVVPVGTPPISVDLAKQDDTHYAGSFAIDQTTGTGMANVLFSARDLVGNRGTEVDAGATLNIDTEGPVLSNIAIVPGAPIKNDTAQTVQATFTFNKAPKSAPQIKYLLSGAVRAPVAIGSLQAVNATTYKGSFVLPADAGLGTPENLTFSHQAQDDLDNVSTKVAAQNRFQVYQGTLPPAGVPYGFAAKAQPGGKVALSWQAVDGASGYQIYRQAPGEAALMALVRTGGVSLVDQTPADGTYKYAVAAIRQSNGDESLSAQSVALDVYASANAPGAPQNLGLSLTGQGILAAWQAPLASKVDSYNLYRSTGTAITSITGLVPIKSKVKTTQAYDTNPSPSEGAYVVTAVDAAGNESAISNSAYLNASLLPVRNLHVVQAGTDLPLVSWSAPNGNVAGYLVYVGPDANKTRLTQTKIAATSLTDTGFTSGERRYTVATVDANGVEMPRSIALPNVVTQIVSGLPIRRGIFNKLQVQVTNMSSSSLANVRVIVRLPIDSQATQFKDHASSAITLGANETRLVPVIVGGYADLPATAQADVGIEIAATEDELVKLSHKQAVNVTEGALVVGMATDEFTRGATGKVKLTIENTSDVDVELLTATGNGTGDSSELRFKILDGDGNVLAVQPYKQVFGANVVTLPNGQTVARIPAGTSYVSDVFNLAVPGSSPNAVRVKLEVDKLRYHTGQDDEVTIAGRGSEKTVSLLDTAYVGEATGVSPLSSFGDQNVIITGRALERTSNTPLPNTRLKLVLNQQGFERTFDVLTDGTGNFSYTFKPTLTDSGLYKVSVVHPDMTDRPEQKSFTINRVTVGPTPYKLDLPKNLPFTVPFTAKAGPGTAATNLRLTLDAASQVMGQIPAGITVQLPPPVTLSERQTLNMPVQFTAGSEAQLTGSLIFNVVSDESAGQPIGQVTLNYALTEAKPYLVNTPSYVETGLGLGATQVESVTIKNSGLQDAMNLQFTLTKSDGSPAPAWASIASQANGTLAVGTTRSIDLMFAPPSGTSEGVYQFKLTAAGDNVPASAMDVYVSVSQSGKGNVMFKAADIFTATMDKEGRLIRGLANASITLQNEGVATITVQQTTDTLGEAMFNDLPAGQYQFKAKADNHQEIGGRLIVKPGVTFTQPVFLKYNTVTVEWSVREIAIQDRYDITINATFETDVPAAVVVLQPASVNLPKMAVGDVYYGELTLTNYGLIRADDVSQKLPVSDGMFRYEFLTEVPASLAPKQRVTIPYRVIALQSLDGGASTANASGGGCYSYNNSTLVNFGFICANGSPSSGSASTSFFSASNSSCPAGGAGGGAGGGWSGGGGGVGGAGAGSTSTPIRLKGKKCVTIPSGATQCE